MSASLEDIKRELTVLRLVKNTSKGFEHMDVLTSKGYEQLALEKAQKGLKHKWRVIVKSDKQCNCGKNFDDWGIFNSTDGWIRILKCEDCRNVLTEKSSLLDLAKLITEGRL